VSPGQATLELEARDVVTCITLEGLIHVGRLGCRMHEFTGRLVRDQGQGLIPACK